MTFLKALNSKDSNHVSGVLLLGQEADSVSESHSNLDLILLCKKSKVCSVAFPGVCFQCSAIDLKNSSVKCFSLLTVR